MSTSSASTTVLPAWTWKPNGIEIEILFHLTLAFVHLQSKSRLFPTAPFSLVGDKESLWSAATGTLLQSVLAVNQSKHWEIHYLLLSISSRENLQQPFITWLNHNNLQTLRNKPKKVQRNMREVLECLFLLCIPALGQSTHPSSSTGWATGQHGKLLPTYSF